MARYLYTNREIAWLAFNDRVLGEAADPTNPVVERMIFLGIYSNNNDEFFRVRVASLKRLLAKKKSKIEYDAKPAILLKNIRQIVSDQLKRFEEIFEWNIEELKKSNIFLLDETQVDEEQGLFIKKFFREHVRRYIYPVFLEHFKDQEELRDKSNFLAVQMWKKETPHQKVNTIIEIPVDRISRFLRLPDKGSKHYLILLDDIIRYCISDIFAPFGYDSYHSYTFKFIRDAELDIDFTRKAEQSYDFLGFLSEHLKERTHSNVVRLVHEVGMPVDLIRALKDLFQVGANDIFDSRGRYQNKKDFVGFPKDFDEEHLVYPKFIHREVKRLPIRKSKFEVIREGDIMLHYPYQSFQHLIDLIREASLDPCVESIKMTVYRVAKDSSIMNALINAARNGKKVYVFMELMARFDEENNIYWTKRFEKENVKVLDIIPGTKVHAKLISIGRRENGKLRYYAAVGTGNPNEQTAKVYVDKQLLTANKRITTEVNRVFASIANPKRQSRYSALLVAPVGMRQGFERMIDREIENARMGRPAWMKMVINNLADKQMVDKLYEASKAGVKIKMVVRGICILKPGLKGVSENIEVYSIVDRFLEHSRIFIFSNNNHPQYYIGSADWMTRNLDYRVEVDCPIYDPEIKKDLDFIVDAQFKDNTHSRLITARYNTVYKPKQEGEETCQSQREIYRYLVNKYA